MYSLRPARRRRWKFSGVRKASVRKRLPVRICGIFRLFFVLLFPSGTVCPAGFFYRRIFLPRTGLLPAANAVSVSGSGAASCFFFPAWSRRPAGRPPLPGICFMPQMYREPSVRPAGQMMQKQVRNLSRKQPVLWFSPDGRCIWLRIPHSPCGLPTGKNACVRFCMLCRKICRTGSPARVSGKQAPCSIWITKLRWPLFPPVISVRRFRKKTFRRCLPAACIWPLRRGGWYCHAASVFHSVKPGKIPSARA